MAGFFVAKIETVYIVIPSERLCRHIIGDPAPRRCVGPAKYFALRQANRVKLFNIIILQIFSSPLGGGRHTTKLIAQKISLTENEFGGVTGGGKVLPCPPLTPP